jgi:quinol monooxygenase YgiN
MIVRIVKMTFLHEQTNVFMAIFERSKSLIRHFPGCSHLELLQDTRHLHIFYTYSYWSDEEALENYRQSDLFKSTWAQTKVLFAAKAEAVSLSRIAQIE